MSLYVIGLTGNIACGKSTVVAMLRERGAAVIDADDVVHQLQRPGEPVYNRIVAMFGSGILASPGGPIDRPMLGAIVFNDKNALAKLEAIIHPAVREHVRSWLDEQRRAADAADEPRVAVIDAIKLLEGGYRAVCNAIWVVTCPPEQQLARLIQTRGLSEGEARTRINAQSPQSEKAAQADVVIDNSGTLADTAAQVDAAFAQIAGA